MRTCFSDKIPVRKSAAVEYTVKQRDVLLIYFCRTVDIFAVNAYRRGNICRTLHSAFDFQRADTDFFKLRNMFKRTQILKAQIKCFFAVSAYGVRQPARLGAFAAVSRTSADNTAHKALPGIAHTKCAVSENFKFSRGFCGYFGKFRSGKLPR